MYHIYPDNETILRVDSFLRTMDILKHAGQPGCRDNNPPHPNCVVLDDVVWLIDMPLKRQFAETASSRGVKDTLRTTTLLIYS